MVEQITNLQEVREDLRNQLIIFPEGLRAIPTANWWKSSYRFVRGLEKHLPNYPTDVQAHLGHILTHAKQMLVDEVNNIPSGGSLSDSEIEHRADHMIYELSRFMSAPYCESPADDLVVRQIPIEDIVASRPDILKTTETENECGVHRVMHVKNPITRQTYTFPLPRDSRIFYKGGVARLMLNFIADAPLSMIANEIPWSDLDIVALGDDANMHAIAGEMGVDPDGVEMAGTELDFAEYSLGRDVDHNQVLLGDRNLYYTSEAFDAAHSGHITLTGLYMPNRALYGTDIFKRHGYTLGTPRGLMRLVKPLVEGKAISFSYQFANKYVDMTPYFLFLARKWSKKENFPVLLQRLIAIGKLMGQIPEDEKNTIEILERMHQQYPLFDLGAMVQSVRDVALWKAGKIIRQADREFTWQFSVATDLQIPEAELALPEVKISLEGFEPDPVESANIIAEWSNFLERSRIRAQQTQNNPNLKSNRYFLKNDFIRRSD